MPAARRRATQLSRARMSTEEKRLARDWHFNDGEPPAVIAKRLKRHVSSVCRLLAQRRQPKSIGRPRLLSEEKVAKLIRELNKMIDQAEGGHEVTVALLKRRTKTKASTRTILDALHEKGYYFRGMREKPPLTPEEVKERHAWAKEYVSKTENWWKKRIQVRLDNHCFKVATTARARTLLAQRTVRGVYRKKGKSLRRSLLKPGKKMRQNTVARGALMAGGIGGGKVLVWSLQETKWCAQSASDFYHDGVRPALDKRWPRTKRFTILEDNDPTGNTSGLGKQAKKGLKLDVFVIPKRSPDLNVMDYAVWSEIERKMRTQERNWKKAKRETREQYIDRVQHTAQSLSKGFIDSSIGNLKRRCSLLLEAKGGLFEEGGRAPKKARRPL